MGLEGKSVGDLGKVFFLNIERLSRAAPLFFPLAFGHVCADVMPGAVASNTLKVAERKGLTGTLMTSLLIP